MMKKAVSGGCELNACVAAAFEQLCAEQRFQSLDLVGQCRWRNIELQGGVRKMSLLRQRDEVPKKPRFDVGLRH
jgi:hypothetical protein